MASITKRQNGWFVQIRRKGFEPLYKTLATKRAAEEWARNKEAAMDRGDGSSSVRVLREITLGSLIERYIEEETPKKRSAESEELRLRKLLLAPVCALALHELSPAALAHYRDGRLKAVKAGTVVRELSLIHTVLNLAQREWNIPLTDNPVSKVTRPRLKNARDRRLNMGELRRLKEALADTRNPLIAPIVFLAIETGLRRGELLKLEWKHIDLKARTAHIPDTKTGYARTIPLTDTAIAILIGLGKDDLFVFPLTAMALRLAWNRLRVRAGVPDLRLHDLRHEAISRFAEMGLTTVELAVISGHRDPRMLFRYTHLRPADLARKLAGRSWYKEVQQFR